MPPPKERSLLITQYKAEAVRESWVWISFQDGFWSLLSLPPGKNHNSTSSGRAWSVCLKELHQGRVPSLTQTSTCSSMEKPPLAGNAASVNSKCIMLPKRPAGASHHGDGGLEHWPNKSIKEKSNSFGVSGSVQPFQSPAVQTPY